MYTIIYYFILYYIIYIYIYIIINQARERELCMCMSGCVYMCKTRHRITANQAAEKRFRECARM